MRELHEDEDDPKLMFQDIEHCDLFEKLGLIGESFLSPEIYEIAEQINDSGHSVEVYEACLHNLGKVDFQNLDEYVNNFYYGEYDSMKILYSTYMKMIRLIFQTGL